MTNQNEERWTSLWGRLGAQGDAHAVYFDLVARYSEPHRAYHTFDHIGYCLHELDRVRDFVTNLDAVELAIWYHDAIYDTRTKDSEERSTTLALEMVKSALLPDRLGRVVVNLIMATKHSGTPTDLDTQLLVDVDLSILGQSEARFDEYESQIRKEYGWVPKNEFVAGRSIILKLFLSRPVIYLTQFFRDKYENKARQNIARSLACLKA